MKIPANKVIHLAPGETLPGYKKIRPVPDEYIDGIKEIINKLNVTNQPGALLFGLKQIYEFIDLFNKNFVSSFTTCEKGCNACCSMDVQLTPFEAEYIALSTNIPHRDSKLSTGHESTCPFLSENGSCSIYDFRPLLCRTYHVLSDPALCKDLDAEVMQYGAQSSNMGNFIYQTAARWIYHQTTHTFGKLDFRDIRDFFPYERIDIQTYLDKYKPSAPC